MCDSHGNLILLLSALIRKTRDPVDVNYYDLPYIHSSIVCAQEFWLFGELLIIFIAFDVVVRPTHPQQLLL